MARTLVSGEVAPAAAAGVLAVQAGLIVERWLVEAHGGRIWAESVVGVSSTFSFSLPIAAGRARGDREGAGNGRG